MIRLNACILIFAVSLLAGGCLSSKGDPDHQDPLLSKGEKEQVAESRNETDGPMYIYQMVYGLHKVIIENNN